MSRVFVARDESLGRDVVIKLLSPELVATLSAERFTREIKLAAALQEPPVVPVHAAVSLWIDAPRVRSAPRRGGLRVPSRFGATRGVAFVCYPMTGR